MPHRSDPELERVAQLLSERVREDRDLWARVRYVIRGKWVRVEVLRNEHQYVDLIGVIDLFRRKGRSKVAFDAHRQKQRFKDWRKYAEVLLRDDGQAMEQSEGTGDDPAVSSTAAAGSDPLSS